MGTVAVALIVGAGHFATEIMLQEASYRICFSMQ